MGVLLKFESRVVHPGQLVDKGGSSLNRVVVFRLDRRSFLEALSLKLETSCLWCDPHPKDLSVVSRNYKAGSVPTFAGPQLIDGRWGSGAIHSCMGAKGRI